MEFVSLVNFHNFRFIMYELELAVTSESKYFRINENFNAETETHKPFLLKDDKLSFHMYVSQAPCKYSI